MYYVYVLQSKTDGSFYTGFTTDLQKRVKEHNSGTMKYTKGKIPFDLAETSASAVRV